MLVCCGVCAMPQPLHQLPQKLRRRYGVGDGQLLLLVGLVVFFIDDVHDASLALRGIHPPPPAPPPAPALAFDAGEDPLEQHAVTVNEQVWEETEEEREAQEDPHHLYHSVGLVQDIHPPEDVKVGGAAQYPLPTRSRRKGSPRPPSCVTHQNAAELARAAEARAYKGEIILLVTDRSTIDLAVNLVLNLRRLHLEHYLLVAESAETCSIIHVRTDLPRR